MNSRLEYTGVTGTSFSYANLDLLADALVSEQSQLVVTVNGTALAYDSGAPSAGEYSLNKTTRNVTLGTALVSTDILLIRRSTKKDAMHVVFTNNSPIAQDDLNLAFKQCLFIAQEASEAQDVQRQFENSGQIVGYANKSYTLTLKAQNAFDIISFTTKLTGGTATVSLAIDGVAVTGSSTSATTSETTKTGMTNNRVLVGQTLTLVVASASLVDTFDLSFTLACEEV